MLENALVRKITDSFHREEKINQVEIKVYLELIKDKEKYSDDKTKFAEDIFSQLMDKKVKRKNNNK